MPRQSRIDAPGALHHIISRGIEKRTIFKDGFDRSDFLKNLGSILKETETSCYAWALMPNHFHLLLRSSVVPIATVMRRILTGHAVRFNKRHKRHGHLFQNRYKSILCQDDKYLLELVRYIHLNPLRSNLVENLIQLDKYPFCGHSVILGNRKESWQSDDEVLKLFAKKLRSAKRLYRDFIANGINLGRRNDLVGGGLVRSAGGWESIRELKESKIHMKSDERILGDSDFVLEVLSRAEETIKQKYRLNADGIDIDFIVKRAASIAKIDENDIWCKGKYRKLVRARSLLCYWAVRELGESMSSMARKLNISAVSVSKSVERGAEIVKKEGLKLIS